MERVTFPEDLIARARAGEEEAFLEVYALARLLLLRLCRTHFRLGPQDAEDLFQEVIFSFHRNLPRIENPAAWLNAAGRNVAQRLWSRREERWEEKCDPRRSDGSLEESLMMWESVWKLTPYCRRIVLKLIIQEYTEVETARDLRINDRTLHLHKKKCVADLYHLYLGVPDGC